MILKRPYHKGPNDTKGQKPKWQILAVGRVTGEYEHLEQFDDVEGWDLQHCRRVEWTSPRKEAGANGLTMGTFKRVYTGEVIEQADEILREGEKREGEKRESEEIPHPAGKISDEDLVESLIGNGMRPADAETVIQTIWQVRRMARWYARHGGDLSEHEIRTFLIVPILLALGWSEQKIKIEWKNTDMSFFSGVYKKGEEPCMILESKRMWEGLHHAEWQAKRYAKKFPTCQRLVASEGNRYRLYVKRDGEWPFKAYMNLLNLKDRHPYLTDIGGAPDLFTSLMPS